MNEPRKIVLILGNGFDLDLGLKTSYKDFWESEFCPKDYPAPLIRHLNSRWGNNLESVRWYDLENELLVYALRGDKTDVVSNIELNYLTSKSEHQIYNDFHFLGGRYEIASLVEKDYIIIENSLPKKVKIPYKNDFSLSIIERDKKAFQLIKVGLCKYINSLDTQLHNENKASFHILLAMSKAVKAGDLVDIFTFNYTRVQIRGDRLTGIPVYYMHGNCEDGNIIIGTRDDLSLTEGYDFLQKVMDESFMPPDIVNALRNADEVIFFGHSLGENDRQYFSPFFLKQSDYNNQIEKDIVFFTRDSNSKIEIKRALQKMTGGNLSSLYSLNHPIIIRTKELNSDQKLMDYFLVSHHTDVHFAKEVIGTLL